MVRPLSLSFCLFLITFTHSKDITVLLSNLNSTYVDRKNDTVTLNILEETSIGKITITDWEELQQKSTLSLFLYGTENITNGVFDNLPNLTKLEIVGGRLKNIRSGIFNNLNLTNLILIQDEIENISSDAFDNMVVLEKINLGGNNLKEIDANWFSGKPNLKEINLANNCIENVPTLVFTNSARETELTLRLTSNHIKTISDDAFHHLKKIKALDLSGNRLESFSGKSLQGVEIRGLKLSQNPIRCFKGEDFGKVFVAEVTIIEGFLWKSGCLEKVKEWIDKHRKNVVLDRHDYGYLKNRNLIDL